MDLKWKRVMRIRACPHAPPRWMISLLHTLLPAANGRGVLCCSPCHTLLSLKQESRFLFMLSSMVGKPERESCCQGSPCALSSFQQSGHRKGWQQAFIRGPHEEGLGRTNFGHYENGFPWLPLAFHPREQTLQLPFSVLDLVFLITEYYHNSSTGYRPRFPGILRTPGSPDLAW